MTQELRVPDIGTFCVIFFSLLLLHFTALCRSQDSVIIRPVLVLRVIEPTVQQTTDEVTLIETTVDMGMSSGDMTTNSVGTMTTTAGGHEVSTTVESNDADTTAVANSDGAITPLLSDTPVEESISTQVSINTI